MCNLFSTNFSSIFVSENFAEESCSTGVAQPTPFEIQHNRLKTCEAYEEMVIDAGSDPGPVRQRLSNVPLFFAEQVPPGAPLLRACDPRESTSFRNEVLA